jgi:hypothetical protein
LQAAQHIAGLPHSLLVVHLDVDLILRLAMQARTLVSMSALQGKAEGSVWWRKGKQRNVSKFLVWDIIILVIT